MEASADRHWLRGDPAWWPLSRDADDADALAPRERSHEQPAPDEWVAQGWMRQRLRPGLPRLVFPASWSIGLLAMSTLPLVFPDNTPDDQMVSLALFLLGWLLLWSTPVKVANSQPDGRPGRVLLWLLFGGGRSTLVRTWSLALAGSALFVLHIIVDVRLGWLAYALFLLLWLDQLQRIAGLLAHPQNLWVLPVVAGELVTDSFGPGWVAEHPRFRRGPLAVRRLADGRRLELRGLTRSRSDFVAMQLRHSSGLLIDPFVDSDSVPRFDWLGLGGVDMRAEGLQSELRSPPPGLPATVWPARFLSPAEEE